MANLANLLSQLEVDDIKYYLLKGRELYTEDKIELLCNDNNSTKIGFIIPKVIGGINLDSQVNVYIDFLDGKGKPGTVSLETEITKVIDQNGNNVDNADYSTFIEFDPTTNTLSAKENTGYITTIIDNNHYIIMEDTSISTSIDETLLGDYYVSYNIEETGSRTYISNVVNENVEDSARVSMDYPSGYADSTYFKKISTDKNLSLTLETGNDSEGNEVDYGYIEWTINKEVTENVGAVTFALRLEASGSSNLKWQSDRASFLVKENLKEYYSLKREIEENFIIQNREIKPVGDFNAVLVKGDSNSNKLFYKMNRYFQGQDMLAPKQIEAQSGRITNQYTVFKSKNDQGANIYYGLNLSNNNLYYLQTDYYINEIYFKDRDNNVYYWRNGAGYGIEIGDYTFSNFEVYRSYDKVYYIKYDTYNSLTKSTTVGIIVDIGLELTNEFPLETGIDVVASFDMYANKLTPVTTVSGLSLDDVVPVFNRIIRFVFSSPNKDYSDYNIGEIEYINNEEDYFIFSWTPNYQVTRSEGEVSYTIEFYINSIENIIDSNGNTIQPKAYSWSTLPSTITIENNDAATASVDYIPNWVSYIENYFQNDFNEFLNTDLQVQVDELEDKFQSAIGLNLEAVNGTREDDSLIYSFTINDNTFNILVQEESSSSETTYKVKQEDYNLVNMHVLEGTNFVYTSAYNLTLGEETLLVYIYFNSVDKTCTIYYTTEFIDSPVIPEFENRVNDVISNFNRQVYNDPENQTFNYDNTLQTQIEDMLDDEAAKNEENRNNLINQIEHINELLSINYNGVSQNLTIYTADSTEYPLSYLEDIVTINNNNFNWDIKFDDSLNSVVLVLTPADIQSNIDEGIDNEIYFTLNNNLVSIEEGTSTITLSANTAIFKNNDDEIVNSIDVTNSFNTIYNITFSIEKVDNTYIISTNKEFIIPITTAAEAGVLNETNSTTIYDTVYGCYVYTISDDLDTQIQERTSEVSSEVETNITNLLIGEGGGTYNLNNIGVNSLFGQLSTSIQETLMPYTQGAEGVVYQTIFSNIVNLTNIDDISSAYDSYVTAAQNNSGQIMHSFSNGILTITNI